MDAAALATIISSICAGLAILCNKLRRLDFCGLVVIDVQSDNSSSSSTSSSSPRPSHPSSPRPTPPSSPVVMITTPAEQAVRDVQTRPRMRIESPSDVSSVVVDTVDNLQKQGSF